MLLLRTKSTCSNFLLQHQKKDRLGISMIQTHYVLLEGELADQAVTTTFNQPIYWSTLTVGESITVAISGLQFYMKNVVICL